MPDRIAPSRRLLLKRLVSGGGAALLGASGIADVLAQRAAPAIVTSDRLRPQLPGGVMSGDVTDTRAIVWSRTDRPARMIVDYATDESFRRFERRIGPAAIDATGLSARVDLAGLPSGADVFYRVRFQDLANDKVFSEPVTGRLRTPSARADRPVCFVFSGDEAGQGWGINERFGGYRIYEAMRREAPDFFIHSGDQIYADGPIQPEVKLPDGTLWTNLVTEAKSHVAQTLDDYRGAFAYSQLDRNKRRFMAEVPFLVQWDDHEVRNNWYPGQQIGPEEARYQTRSASLLSAYARQAMFEYNPFRINQQDPEQIYRSFAFGPLLDVFMLDERSYRGRNSPNRQAWLDADSAFLGAQQSAWLKASLKRSRATWKVIASDMPISLVVPDLNPDVPKGTYEAWANGDDGAPSGRELELADILSFIKRENIENVVWVTADVHYAQAAHYHPSRAKFTDFKPFWEFVGGPINAGTFGPNDTDMTFGPALRYVSVPKDNPQNRSPAAGQQYYGRAKIDPASRAMTVSLHDLDGKSLFEVKLDPEA
ncbi:alkaline phosphatase D family protein [Burkholderia stagnalis]|uniref:alkaline phosphatase D family protein n=1 Tax=Burkholderia stagnalis TaxID=1503054 RepID=UPI0007600ED7|nr:alkaline phosphatase D family protein [Burkholderia stagnalis]KWK59657.1 alkaline phosphatase [Burkholderia stagnalis]